MSCVTSNTTPCVIAGAWQVVYNVHFSFLVTVYSQLFVDNALFPLTLSNQIISSFISTAHFRHEVQHNVLHRKKTNNNNENKHKIKKTK